MKVIWVMLSGLPATGKSTLAREMAVHLERCAVLNKDRVRAALFPGPMTDYTSEQDALCMRAMIESARYMTCRHLARHILFDGRTFSHSAQIEEVIFSRGCNRSSVANLAPDLLRRSCGSASARARFGSSGNQP